MSPLWPAPTTTTSAMSFALLLLPALSLRRRNCLLCATVVTSRTAACLLLASDKEADERSARVCAAAVLVQHRAASLVIQSVHRSCSATRQASLHAACILWPAARSATPVSSESESGNQKQIIQSAASLWQRAPSMRRAAGPAAITSVQHSMTVQNAHAEAYCLTLRLSDNAYIVPSSDACQRCMLQVLPREYGAPLKVPRYRTIGHVKWLRCRLAVQRNEHSTREKFNLLAEY